MASRTFATLGLALGLLRATTEPASGHDIYTTLRDPAGRLCCGGDPLTGDCEPIERRTDHPNGSMTIWSKRYGAWVTVGADKITPAAVPESDGVVKYEVHWCGVPRGKVQLAPIQPDNPDTGFWTYCAFRASGGA